MPARKRALLLAIGAAGVVAALSGAVLEGCVAIGFAMEAYVLCCAYLAPGGPDGGDDRGDDGPQDPSDPPPAPPRIMVQAKPPGLVTITKTATATSPAATRPTVETFL